MILLVLSDNSVGELSASGKKIGCRCLQILRESWYRHERVVKTIRTKYLSDIIASNYHSPHICFNTLSCVLNVHEPVPLEASAEACNKFLHFFLDKVVTNRALISPPSHDPSIVIPCSGVFDHF